MDVNRFVLMTLLQVVRALCHRFSMGDLVDECDGCLAEVEARERAEKKEG